MSRLSYSAVLNCFFFTCICICVCVSNFIIINKGPFIVFRIVSLHQHKPLDFDFQNDKMPNVLPRRIWNRIETFELSQMK